jgi:hypothetical protein
MMTFVHAYNVLQSYLPPPIHLGPLPPLNGSLLQIANNPFYMFMSAYF